MWPLLLTSRILLVGRALLVPCSCCKITQAGVYCGAWPKWAVSVNVFSLTAGFFFVSKL